MNFSKSDSLRPAFEDSLSGDCKSPYRIRDRKTTITNTLLKVLTENFLKSAESRPIMGDKT